MGEVFQERTGHLLAQHAAFFAHWYNLVAVEESGLTQKRAEIWSVTGGLPTCTAPTCHTILSCFVRSPGHPKSQQQSGA